MRRVREALVLLVLLGIGVAAGGGGTYARWSSADSNTQNRIGTGHLDVSGADVGGTVFTFSNVQPGALASRCVRVTNAGNVPTKVFAYGDVSGALAQHMTVRVTRGAKDALCASPGTGTEIYSGPLDALPETSGAALDGTFAWDAGASYPFTFELTLTDTAAAQGLTTSVGMTWEGRP